jgi:hypothetical protein
MILGPTPPHPRELLFDWARQLDADGRSSSSAAELCFERGLVPIASQLDFETEEGSSVSFDVLARDASGATVAMLAFDADDADEAVDRIVSLDCWFERSRDLLRQLEESLRPDPGLEPTLGLRVFVVTRNVGESFYARLMRLGGIDLSVFDLRSLRVGKERRLALVSVAPWDAGPRGRELDELPAGLESAELRGLYQRLLERLSALPGELAAHGDRYDREIRLGGQTILHLHVQAGVLWASVPASGESEARPRVSIRGTADLDRVLDLVLRVLLERDRAGQNGARGNKSVVSFAEDAPRLQIQAHTPELSEKYSEELSEDWGERPTRTREVRRSTAMDHERLRRSSGLKPQSSDSSVQ